MSMQTKKVLEKQLNANSLLEKMHVETGKNHIWALAELGITSIETFPFVIT